MRHRIAGRLLGVLLGLSGATALAQGTHGAVTVPLGGNAFVTRPTPARGAVVDGTGLHHWDARQAVVSVYFDVQQAGTLDLSLVRASKGAGRSVVKVSVGRQAHTVRLSPDLPPVVPVGRYAIRRPGYVKVDLQGLSRQGGDFGDLSGLRIGGSATAAGTVFANDPANFYWSRRGPSVHLMYAVPADTEYFYSEVTVPKGQDPVGTYAMADGFSVGYFGMQVNSATQRRILFSVWDSRAGKTTLVRKGPGVVANAFGGEGTGGQSHLDYPWVAGATYRFLVRARPDGHGNTDFSAWFGPALHGHGRHAPWHFIATWRYAGAATWLKGVYSFLESFDPDLGYLGRSARYGDQWAVTSDGRWHEITTARYDVDPTGLHRQRLDFAGGVAGRNFFLRNDGFFSDSTPSGQTFTRAADGHHPDVDLDALP